MGNMTVKQLLRVLILSLRDMGNMTVKQLLVRVLILGLWGVALFGLAFPSSGILTVVVVSSTAIPITAILLLGFLLFRVRKDIIRAIRRELSPGDSQ